VDGHPQQLVQRLLLVLRPQHLPLQHQMIRETGVGMRLVTFWTATNTIFINIDGINPTIQWSILDNTFSWRRRATPFEVYIYNKGGKRTRRKMWDKKGDECKRGANQRSALKPL
jgi:hypothetical protein